MVHHLPGSLGMLPLRAQLSLLEEAQAAHGEAHMERNLAPSPQAWLVSQPTDSREMDPFGRWLL